MSVAVQAPARLIVVASITPRLSHNPMGDCGHADECTPIENERDGLLAFLEHQREAVRNATYGLREDQARLQPTPSALSLGGLVKHLAQAERDWSGHIANAPSSGGSIENYMAGFALTEEETLAEVLEQYLEASRHTDAVIQNVEDLRSPCSATAGPLVSRSRGLHGSVDPASPCRGDSAACRTRRHHSLGSRRSVERAADGSGGRMARCGLGKALAATELSIPQIEFVAVPANGGTVAWHHLFVSLSPTTNERARKGSGGHR